ncbi:MAG TPA: hypothetical protein VGN86_10830, partial [Pyrinomonadaceae bacterium]|nr:hypothetical protein [Pyrinomonadaceae bacterium]
MNFKTRVAQNCPRLEPGCVNKIFPQSLTVLFVIAMLLALPTVVAASVGAHVHPNLARGAANIASQDATDWDSVNLFNGNLNLSLPLGISYPLTSNFNYQFSLNYNSNIWDLTQVTSTVLRAEPNRYSNAGLGWDLSFGRLIDPTAADNGDLNKWVYVSPDGAYHPFYSTLHPDIYEPEDNIFYTRDGTYFRLQQLSGASAILESPDGKIMTFEFANGEWRLIKIADQFKTNGVANNYLSISYATNNVWAITDNHGRTQTVYFKSDSTGVFPRLVDRVELAAFGGGKATYTFAYVNTTVSRPTADNDPATAATVTVPLLTGVTAPDGSKDNFGYYPAGAAADSSGRLANRQLPTLGKIDWTYQGYSFVSAGC